MNSFFDTDLSQAEGHDPPEMNMLESWLNPAGTLAKLFPKAGPCEDYPAELNRHLRDRQSQLKVTPGSHSGTDVDWFTLDFPALALEVLCNEAAQPLRDTLEGLDIHLYIGTCPEGGCVGFVFLERAVPRDTVAKHAEAICLFLVEGDLEGARSSGQTPLGEVLLPYVGSLHDGQGANPLWRVGGLKPLSIYDLPEKVQRTGVKKLVVLAEQIEDETTPVLEPVSPPKSILDHWQDELARVAPYWGETTAEFLSLGLAGFGVYLGLPEDHVLEDVRVLATNADDAKVEERLKIVKRTYANRRNGKKVSFKSWYEKARLLPPEVLRPPQVVLERVRTLEAFAEKRAWPGRGASSDQAAYLVLLGAREYGREHPGGVQVSMSLRTLATKANISFATATKVVKRLREQELIGRPPAPKEPKGDKAGTFELYLTKDAKLLSEDTNLLHQDLVEVAAKWVRLVSLARYGRNRLGKPATQALEVLASLGGKATLETWNDALKKNSRNTLRSRKKLVEKDLVTLQEKHYELTKDWEERFHALLEQDGSLRARACEEERFKRERESFAELRRRKGYV